MSEKFPLDWPVGYKRTLSRKNSKFVQNNPDKVQTALYRQLELMKAKKVIISSNIPPRKDGRMYTEYLLKKIEDPGIAVYFNYNGEDVVMCCDTFHYPIDNLYALTQAIGAIRSMERWGVSEFIKRAFTGFKALPAELSFNWWETLGISKDASLEEIKAAYRNLTKVHHPDAGGSADMFNRISKAYQQAISK